MTKFMVSKSSHDIILLDADDVIHRLEIITLYAKLVALDPSELKWQWQPITQGKLVQIPDAMGKRYVSTIASSAGIVPGKTSEGLDMGVEAKWKEEFGEILGEKMREWVVAAMPDYEFLRERRLRKDQQR